MLSGATRTRRSIAEDPPQQREFSFGCPGTASPLEVTPAGGVNDVFVHYGLIAPMDALRVSGSMDPPDDHGYSDPSQPAGFTPGYTDIVDYVAFATTFSSTRSR